MNGWKTEYVIDLKNVTAQSIKHEKKNDLFGFHMLM